MKIQQMEQIMEVYTCKSINKAAQRLYISQSALSASINAAEKELGRQILVRSHNGVELTEFGTEFIKALREILAIYKTMLSKSADGEEPRLCVSCQYLLYAHSIFTALCDRYSGSQTNFRYVEKTRDLVCQDLLDRVSELGFITTPTTSRNDVLRTLETNGLVYKIIATTESCCMVGPKNPLYQNEEDSVVLSQLARYPCLQYEVNEWLWGPNAFRDELLYFPHTGTLSISDSGSFHNFLLDTNCTFIGIHNRNAYQKTKFYDNIRVLRIADASFPYDTICIRRKNTTMTPIAREYLRRICASLGSIHGASDF